MLGEPHRPDSHLVRLVWLGKIVRHELMCTRGDYDYMGKYPSEEIVPSSPISTTA